VAVGSFGPGTLASDPLLVAMHGALTQLVAAADTSVRAAEVATSCRGSTCVGFLGRIVAIAMLGIALASAVFLLLLGRALKRQLDW
jgi:hypothetical protein